MLLQGLLSCAVNERWAALRTLGAGEHINFRLHVTFLPPWRDSSFEGQLSTEAVFACHRELR